MKIIVARGKHDTTYIEYADDSAWLKLFKEYKEYEYYFFEDLDDYEKELGKIDVELQSLALLAGKSQKVDSAIKELSLRKRRLERDILSTKTQKELYSKALKGDAQAAKKLCNIRRDYEYETWTIEETI